MPITTTEIARYSVNVLSEGEPNQLAATVRLFGTSAQTVGFLAFYRDGITMPPTSSEPTSGIRCSATGWTRLPRRSTFCATRSRCT